MAEQLPEGTDQIVPGAGSNNNRDGDHGTARSKPRIDASDLGDKAGDLKDKAGDFRDKAQAKAAEFTGQATDKARTYAKQGKERASSSLDSVAKLIGDSAGHIDGSLGATYGDYIRKAADAVSDFSTTLRDKDVDELVDDARDLVRRSPAIAIGAAAAAGFVIARIIKAGSEALDENAKAAKPPSTAKSPPKAKTAATKPSTVKRATTPRKPKSTG